MTILLKIEGEPERRKTGRAQCLACSAGSVRRTEEVAMTRSRFVSDKRDKVEANLGAPAPFAPCKIGAQTSLEFDDAGSLIHDAHLAYIRCLLLLTYLTLFKSGSREE
jgi:hypothetical protein